MADIFEEVEEMEFEIVTMTDENGQDVEFSIIDNVIYDKNSDYILNQIQFSLNYKFLDRFSTEISYFKKFSNKNSLGFILSFIFEY